MHAEVAMRECRDRTQPPPRMAAAMQSGTNNRVRLPDPCRNEDGAPKRSPPMPAAIPVPDRAALQRRCA